ncbi:hypothetical protein Pla8534_00400 [Lignipirellula cremea]|uniref:Uncharacterized protein n=1 Tax=Lignipirellula cremea TaxID=2528010 RepID=A0A518DKD4_9BACT|nr:hypothetical protein Pla8534_00400 [Lignipirellula cremea]
MGKKRYPAHPTTGGPFWPSNARRWAQYVAGVDHDRDTRHDSPLTSQTGGEEVGPEREAPMRRQTTHPPGNRGSDTAVRPGPRRTLPGATISFKAHGPMSAATSYTSRKGRTPDRCCHPKEATTDDRLNARIESFERAFRMSSTGAARVRHLARDRSHAANVRHRTSGDRRVCTALHHCPTNGRARRTLHSGSL